MHTDCDSCGLSINPKIDATNRKEPTGIRVAFIGEAPGSEDAKESEPFSGISGKLLRSVVKQLGYDVDQALLTNIVCCKPPYNRPPSNAEISLCRPRLEAEIEAYAPDRIVLLGATAFNAFFPNHKITESRGQFLEWKGIDCVGTWSPAKVLRIPSDMSDFTRDIEHALDWDFPVTTMPTYRFAEVEDIECLMHDSDDYVLDIETTGLDWRVDELTLIGISNSSSLTWIITREFMEANLELVTHFLETKWFVGHTIISFDAPFLKERYGIKINVMDDILLMHYSVDERVGTHDLEQMAVNFYGVPKWKDTFGSDLYQYLAMDCSMTYMLWNDLRKLMDSDDSKNYTESLLPTAHFIADMSKNGVLIDQDYLRGLGAKWEDRSVELLSKLRTLTNLPKFNPRSPKQVAELVYDSMGCREIGGRSTAQQYMSKLAEVEIGPVNLWLVENGYSVASTELPELPPRLQGFYNRYFVIQGIIDYRQLTHIKKLYVDNIIDACDADGKVRTHYKIHGTETGRLSSTEPNLQNIPHHMEFGIIRGKEIRDAFIATPGWKFVECDYKALEIRVLAYFSRDDQLIKDILSSDLHTSTASRMFGVPLEEVTKVQRFNAKSINFGTMYKRGAWDMAVKLGIPQAMAQEFIDNWFSIYPKAKAWIDATEQFAWDNNCIITPFGKKRRFPLIVDENREEIGRQAINMPIQSMASEICYMGMRNVAKTLDTENIRPILTVHDSVLYEVWDQVWKSSSKDIQIALEDIPLDSPVPFLVDVSIGDRWGSMGEI